MFLEPMLAFPQNSLNEITDTYRCAARMTQVRKTLDIKSPAEASFFSSFVEPICEVGM